jgi:uncharacterized C2H2 Zn-finger protein
MTEQQSTMVCPRCGVWRNLDPAVEYCLEGKVLHKCPRCDKEFQQLSGRYHSCGARLVSLQR